jgi:hypothetical protein
VSGKSIFQLLPAVAEAPMPEVLERSAVVLPAPEVLERSAVLPPAPDVLLRFAPELEAEFAPLLELLVRSWPDVLDELPERPLPEVELASLRGEELLELPVLKPLPVLLPEPLAPAPDAPDSRTSETVTSGAPWLAGNVTMATPNPFCTPLLEEPLRPLPDDEELPLKPLPLDDEELRSALVLDPVPVLEELRSAVVLEPVPLLDEEPIPPEVEELLRSALVPVPLLDEEPIPPEVDDEPDRPLPDAPLASERRLPLPRLPLLPLLEEFTGQLLSSAGFCTSP